MSAGMRPLISYDDIVAPEPTPRTNPPPVPPPAKKRRTNQNQNQHQHQHRQGYAGGGRAHQQHWDDPGSQEPPMMYDDAPAPSAGSSARHAEYHEEEGEADEDESRELTQDEIWDDSALIDAWNSAAAEYEVRGHTCSALVQNADSRIGLSWEGQELEGRAREKITSVSSHSMFRNICYYANPSYPMPGGTMSLPRPPRSQKQTPRVLPMAPARTRTRPRLTSTPSYPCTTPRSLQVTLHSLRPQWMAQPR